MATELTQVNLVLDPDETDRERADEDLQHLITEVSQLEVESIERVTTGPAPEGTRSGGIVELGTVLVGLGASSGLLPMLVGLVKDWLTRRGTGTVRMTIGGDTLELSSASKAQQSQILEEFLRRHGD